MVSQSIESRRALSPAERLGDCSRSEGFESSTALHPAAAAERAERVGKLAEFYRRDSAGAKRGLTAERFELFQRGEYDFGKPSEAPPEPREKRPKLSKAERLARDERIRELFNAGLSSYAISQRCPDIPWSTVEGCVKRNGWIQGADNPPPKLCCVREPKRKPKQTQPAKPKPAKLLPDIEAIRSKFIRELFEQGSSYSEISRRVGSPRSSVFKLVKREGWERQPAAA